MKKVSILMTCFNAKKFLKQSIKSALNQNFKGYELIIIDDGSTDGSKSIINSFNNKKINKFFLKKNIGRTNALNYGLKKCDSEYIAILDADDTSSSDRLNKQFKFLEKNKDCDLVCSFYKMKLSNKKSKVINFPEIKEFKEKLKYFNLIAHSSVMYRANQIKKLKIYNNKFSYAQDYEMILKFLKKNKIGFIPEVLSTININNSNMSNSSKYKKIVVFERVKLLYFSLRNFNFKFLEIINIWLTIIYLMIKYYLI